MFSFNPKLPISAEERAWVDASFLRLAEIFPEPPLDARPIILPNDEFFPEWDGTEECVAPLLQRICGYMGADPAVLEIGIIEDRDEKLKRNLPVYGSNGGWSPAGLYSARENETTVIYVKESLLPFPIILIATLTHEIAHARLLGERHIARDEEHMEPLTDLSKVFFGLGIFTANSSVSFSQSNRGWQTSRLGYLSPQIWGYAHAQFAHLRREARPQWARHLSTDINAYFKSSQAYLARERKQRPPF